MRSEWLFSLALDKSEKKKNGQILDLLGFAAGKNKYMYQAVAAFCCYTCAQFATCDTLLLSNLVQYSEARLLVPSLIVQPPLLFKIGLE